MFTSSLPTESVLVITSSLSTESVLVITTVPTLRYFAQVDKSHPLIALSSQFSVTDPLISRMVNSLAAEVSPSLT